MESWFYTLSAIPQTLAALIALAATFIVHRLEHLNQFIKRDYELARWFLLKFDPDKYSKIFKDMTDGDLAIAFKEASNRLKKGETWLGLEQYQFGGIRDEFPNVIGSYYGFLGYFTSTPDRMAEFIQQRAHNFQENVNNKSRLYDYLKSAIRNIVFPIVFSLILLPLYPLIPKTNMKAVIVAVVVVLAVYSVINTAKSVWEISRL